MPKYIRLTKLTEEGRKNINESKARTERMRKIAEETGGEIEAVYLTFGEYDFVTVANFPDHGSYAEFSLKAGKEGAYESQTMKAVEEDAYDSIIQTMMSRSER
jgi:uncharacterized protein with GYD domain